MGVTIVHSPEFEILADLSQGGGRSITGAIKGAKEIDVEVRSENSGALTRTLQGRTTYTITFEQQSESDCKCYLAFDIGVTGSLSANATAGTLAFSHTASARAGGTLGITGSLCTDTEDSKAAGSSTEASGIEGALEVPGPQDSKATLKVPVRLTQGPDSKNLSVQCSSGTRPVELDCLHTVLFTVYGSASMAVDSTRSGGGASQAGFQMSHTARFVGYKLCGGRRVNLFDVTLAEEDFSSGELRRRNVVRDVREKARKSLRGDQSAAELMRFKKEQFETLLKAGAVSPSDRGNFGAAESEREFKREFNRDQAIAREFMEPGLKRFRDIVRKGDKKG